jgi:hypothetical protein
MTPQLVAAIAAIQPLSFTERQQLIEILLQSDLCLNSPTELRTLSTQFWEGTTLNQLLATKTPASVHNIKDLVADFWPEEDSIDDFLTFLRQQRQAVVKERKN